MKIKRYLTIQGKQTGYAGRPIDPGKVAIYKNKPGLAGDEIMLELNLEIPDGVFLKPSLSVSVSVPDDGNHGPVIDCAVQDNIIEAIRQVSGLNVHLSVDVTDNTPPMFGDDT